MDIKSFFTKNWIHFLIIGIFGFVMFAYFAPEFDGFGLKQHDVEQHKGMSNEIAHHREVTDGEEPLWTNSMFGGMPALQISTLYNGNIFQKMIIGFLGFIGVPAGIFFLHLLGFYILTLCLRIKPIIGMFGAFAYGFASYEIVILQAGHNSKAIAMAFMAPVLGALIMAYRKNWKWGSILFAFFMTWELAANHLQVAYYLGFILLFVGAHEFVKAIKTKEIKRFAITSGGIVGGFLLALFINYGNITLTNDYAKHSIRGANDITINPDGTDVVNPTSGLDIDYITNWSYGVGESFTLLSPYVKGSHSASLGSTQFTETAEKSDLTGAQLETVKNLPVYWGAQPMTSGPVYLGVLVIFLAFMGLVFLDGKLKWYIFAVSVLALMLSWGKNFMGLTEFFVDYVPGYNKFRTVTIILVVLELCMPLLAVLLLQKLYSEREKIIEKKKLFLYASGGFFIFMLVVTVIGLGDNYSSDQDVKMADYQRSGMLNQLNGADPTALMQQYNLNMNDPSQVEEFIDVQLKPFYDGMDGLKVVRHDIFIESMTRSLVILFFGIGILALFFYSTLPSIAIVGGLGVLLLIDLVPVDRNYLGTEEDRKGNFVHWIPKPETLYPLSSSLPDIAIMDIELSQNPKLEAIISKGESKGREKAKELDYSGKDKHRVIESYKFSALNRNTNYRVFDMNGGWGSSRASYFHKSLGGYHGAKLRNIQNLFDFHIGRSNSDVLNMLNVKYIIQGENVTSNREALGNAWLVKEIKSFETANEELQALGGEFEFNNLGSGAMLINGEASAKSLIHGPEKLQYLLTTGDTLTIPLSNGISMGMKAVFVQDALGNTNLVPEQTLETDTLNSFSALVSIELVKEFNPRNEAVMLNSEVKKLSAKTYEGEGTIEMASYAPNKITYLADLKSQQLVVFSEIYYPEGWTATVDGKEVEILKVNYLLRGLEMKSGKHKIEFSFGLPKLDRSNMFAVTGTVILAGLFALGFWKIKEEEETTESGAEK